MTIPSALLLLLLCSTGSEVQSFTVPTLQFRYQTSRDIQPKDDGTKSFYNSRLTVLSASPKDTKPTINNFFQRFSISSSPNSRTGGPNEKIEIISKRPLKNAPPDDNDQSNNSKWKSFKDSIYETVDAIGQVPSSLVGGSNDDTSSDLGNRNAPMEYSKTVGKTVIDNPPQLLSNFIIPQESKTPGEKALMRYQTPEVEPVKDLVKSYNDELDYVPMEEDDLYRSDSRKQFDSAKDRFYNSLDFISSTTKKIVGKEDESPALLESDQRRIRPMARTSINKIPSNPNRQRREKERERKNSIDETKGTIYNVIDGIKTVGGVVIAIPGKVGETVEVTKDVVVNTVEGAKALPGQVQNFVGDVRESVEETKRITQVVSTDIKNIPQTVEDKINETQNSIRETKESIRETKEGVLNAVNKAEEAIYNAKVKVGMEKPKPKPPPPPPPKTASDIALEITGSLLWGVAKGSGRVLVGGTKLAWSAYTSSNKETATKESNDNAGVINKAVKEMDIVEPKPTIQDAEVVSMAVQDAEVVGKAVQDAEVVGKAVQKIKVEKAKPSIFPDFFMKAVKPAAPSVSKASTTKETARVETLAEFDPALDKEVSDALRLAEEALAELEKEEEELSVTNDDIDAAILKAKIAAAKAKKYAAELEEIVGRK